MAGQPCRQPLCPVIVTSGWCPEHKPVPARGVRYDKRRSSRRWQFQARAVIREQPVCAVDGCTERSTDVDHIVAVEDGGDMWARSNLQGLCHSHHSSKSLAEVRRRTFK
jgi:5-methylcytosine-specific restriction protein A